MSTKKVYFENLNGLRFIAFLTVFVGHIFVFTKFKIESPLAESIVGHFFLHADLGVNFFFVLSGFLITFLVLNEKTETTTISLKNFYMRRILRIWPVYFLTIVFGFFIIPFLFNNVDHHNFPFEIDIPVNKIGWYAGFAVNFDMLYNGVGYVMLAVLWSVSVEEQFYLIWPVITRLTSGFVFIGILILLAAASYYYRWVSYTDVLSIKFSTFSVMNHLVIGSAVALGVLKSVKFTLFFTEMKRPFIICIYLLFGLCLPLRGSIYSFSGNTDRFLVSLEPFVFSLFFAFIILEQNYARHSFFKISRFRLMSYLGTISYGLYCYHMISIFLVSLLFNLIFTGYVETSFWLFSCTAVLSFLLTVFFSRISYRYFETRFLQLKSKYAS